MKYLLCAVVLIFLIGCSNDNQITIKNVAAGGVLLNFRAKTYDVRPGNSTTITDIPNGTYDYSTTYEIPPGLKGEASGEALSGELIFEEKSTKINFIYSSMQTDSTYQIGCTKSSTRSLSTLPTSP